MDNEKEIRQIGKELYDFDKIGNNRTSYYIQPRYDSNSDLGYENFLKGDDHQNLEEMPDETKDMVFQEGKNLLAIGVQDDLIESEPLLSTSSLTNFLEENQSAPQGLESLDNSIGDNYSNSKFDDWLSQSNNQLNEYKVENPENTLADNFSKIEDYSQIQGIPFTRDEFIDPQTENLGNMLDERVSSISEAESDFHEQGSTIAEVDFINQEPYLAAPSTTDTID